MERNLLVAEAMRGVAARRRATAAAVAVAWTLAWPGVTGAIISAHSANQVDGWLDAADLSLTAAELEEIAGAIDRSGAGTGPSRPAAVAATASAAE